MTEAEIVPDLISLSTVINCLGQTGRMDHVNKVFEERELHGYVPNVVTFTGLSRGGKMEDALELFNQMVATLGHMFLLAIYIALIDGFWKEGKLDEATK